MNWEWRKDDSLEENGGYLPEEDEMNGVEGNKQKTQHIYTTKKVYIYFLIILI